MHDTEHLERHEHEEPQQGNSPLSQEVLTGNMERLKTLVDHWIEHNKSHAKSYLEWAAKAQESDRPDIARELQAITDLLERADQCLERIRRSL